MNKWACVQKYYDNGQVAAFVFTVPENTQNSYIEKSICDEYTDVFNTEEEAEGFKNSTTKACR